MSLNKRYFQWLPGSPNDGQISILNNIFVDEGEIYYEFNDGEICLEDLIAKFTTNSKDIEGKFVVEILSPNDKWTFEEVKSKTNQNFKDVESQNGGSFEVPTYEDYFKNGDFKSNVGTIKYIPPKTKIVSLPIIDYKDYMSKNDLLLLGIDVPNDDNVNENNNLTNIQDDVKIAFKECDENIIKDVTPDTTPDNNINNVYNDTNPVSILVNSSAKYPSVISMDLTVDLPAKSLFKIANENFENGANTFIDVILSHIDYESIKTSLRDALLNEYQSDDN